MRSFGIGKKAEKEFACYPVGERAMVVEFGQVIDENINKKVQSMTAYLEEKEIKGIQELLPTFRSLMIFYNPCDISYSRLVRKINHCRLSDMDKAGEQKRVLKIPCLYDGEDLQDMETITGLSRQEIIKIHSDTDYRIYMLGFLPGFVYLGGLDERIHAPRLQSPRVRIEPGSVGIGGSQTGIYPMASPGGWRLLGRTPLRMYDAERENPILCKAGEYIRFTPIDQETFHDIKRQVMLGTYQPEWVM